MYRDDFQLAHARPALPGAARLQQARCLATVRKARHPEVVHEFPSKLARVRSPVPRTTSLKGLCQ
jgi:hypothetical protein